MKIAELRRLYKSLDRRDNFTLMITETKNIAISMDYYNGKTSPRDFDKSQAILAIIERLYNKRGFDPARPDAETATLYADWSEAYKAEIFAELRKPIEWID